MATFEGYERREAKILEVLKEYGISSIDECKTICEEKGIKVFFDIWGYDVKHDWDWWYKQVAVHVPHVL